MDVSGTSTESRAAAEPRSDRKDVTEAQHIRIALLGKTGAGKSSLARTILGKSVFKINHTANPGTSKCQTETRHFHKGSITVIDTPGFFDNRKSDDVLKSEIIDSIMECSEGLDAFLILFKVERFTEQENKVVEKMQQLFSEEAFKHAVVVFTHGDQLDDNMKIEEFVSENKYLRDLLEKCGNRCLVVDNKYWQNNQQDEYRNNQVQVAKLFNTAKEMVKSVGRYTNEMLQKVKTMILEEEERLRRSSVDTQENITKQAKTNVSNALKKLAGITTGVLLGALLGVSVMITTVVSVLPELKALMNAGRGVVASGAGLHVAASSGVGIGVAAGVAATAGAIVGGCIGYQEADKADSVEDAVKNTAEAIIKPIKQVVKMLNSTNQQSSEKEMLLDGQS